MYHQPPIIKVFYIHSRRHRINISMKCHWLQEFHTQLKFCHLKISLKHFKVNKHKAKPASCRAAWYLGSSTHRECLGKTRPTSRRGPARAPLPQASLATSEANGPLGHAGWWKVKAQVLIPKFSRPEHEMCPEQAVSQAGTRPKPAHRRPLDGLGTRRETVRIQHRVFCDCKEVLIFWRHFRPWEQRGCFSERLTSYQIRPG